LYSFSYVLITTLVIRFAIQNCSHQYLCFTYNLLLPLWEENFHERTMPLHYRLYTMYYKDLIRKGKLISRFLSKVSPHLNITLRFFSIIYLTRDLFTRSPSYTLSSWKFFRKLAWKLIWKSIRDLSWALVAFPNS